MSHPKAFGGLEVDPLTVFRVVEEVARQDSAAGWNVQLAAAANCMLAWLPDEGAAEIMHSHPGTIIATSFTPGRQATPVDGGYHLSGQWPFVSGGHDCHWVFFIRRSWTGTSHASTTRAARPALDVPAGRQGDHPGHVGRVPEPCG